MCWSNINDCDGSSKSWLCKCTYTNGKILYDLLKRKRLKSSVLLLKSSILPNMKSDLKEISNSLKTALAKVSNYITNRVRNFPKLFHWICKQSRKELDQMFKWLWHLSATPSGPSFLNDRTLSGATFLMTTTLLFPAIMNVRVQKWKALDCKVKSLQNGA